MDDSGRRRAEPTASAPSDLHPPAWRHLLAAYDLSRDKLYGHIKPRKRRGEFLAFLRYLRTLYPLTVRMGSCWTTSAHTCRPPTTRVGDWAAANNVELAYTRPTRAG